MARLAGHLGKLRARELLWRSRNPSIRHPTARLSSMTPSSPTATRRTGRSRAHCNRSCRSSVRLGTADGRCECSATDGATEPTVLSHGSPVSSLAALADGQLAGAGLDGIIKRWPKGAAGEGVVLGHGSKFDSLAVLTDGRLASAGYDGRIKLWPKADTGEPVVLSSDSPVTSLAVLARAEITRRTLSSRRQQPD